MAATDPEAEKQALKANRLQYLFSKMQASSHSTNSLQALKEMKEKVQNDAEFFQLFLAEEGIKQIVLQLSKSDKRIICVSLSILTWCVVKENSTIDVSSLKDVFDSFKCTQYFIFIKAN